MNSDDGWIVGVFQEAEAFQAQDFGEDGPVNITIWRLHIIAAGGAAGRQRTAAGAPVAPLAIAAAFFFFHRNVLNACLIGPYDSQRVFSICAGDRFSNVHLAFCRPPMLIEDEVILPDPAGAQERRRVEINNSPGGD